MDGGKYGYHTPGSPRHWGEEVPGNVPKLVGTGNGSPCGIMVYEGSLLGKDYFGAVFEADAGTRQINFMPLTRKGAAFRSDYKVLLGSDDPWFRPVDMTAAPDGSLFVADWYDGGVGGHNFRDQTTGRIYRVAPNGNKTKAVNYDFATVDGLIEALKSPTIAAQDAARRSLITLFEKQPNTAVAAKAYDGLGKLLEKGEPSERARVLWVIDQSNIKFILKLVIREVFKDADPRIREQAVRIFGRDLRDNGKVEYQDASTHLPAPALAHLPALLPLASDPDAGVRRELILALRNLPTGKVGNALKTLTKLWDGQDRWYLEALGLALEKREPAFISSLFDGTLYGDIDLDNAGQASDVALPPYFPVDRNEAFIPTGTVDAPANALSKTLGLAWRLHRPEVLPLLSRVLPKLKSPEMQQASDDVFAQMRDPETAVVLAGLAMKTDDPSRKRQLLATIGRKLDSAWKPAQHRAEILALVDSALGATRTSGKRERGPCGQHRRQAVRPRVDRDRAGQEGVGRVEGVGRGVGRADWRPEGQAVPRVADRRQQRPEDRHRGSGVGPAVVVEGGRSPREAAGGHARRLPRRPAPRGAARLRPAQRRR